MERFEFARLSRWEYPLEKAEVLEEKESIYSCMEFGVAIVVC